MLLVPDDEVELVEDRIQGDAHTDTTCSDLGAWNSKH